MLLNLDVVLHERHYREPFKNSIPGGRLPRTILQLFRIKSECLKLPAPFGRRIAEPLDADAAGQATFYGCFDEIGRAEGERDGYVDLPNAAPLASAKFGDIGYSTRDYIIQPPTTSCYCANQARTALNCSGRTSLRDLLCGSRIPRALLNGGLCQAIVSDRSPNDQVLRLCDLT